jgi:hypothetical protein
MYIYSHLRSMILPVYLYLCLLLSAMNYFQNRSIMLMVVVIVNIW